jgi:hypothetical protein
MTDNQCHEALVEAFNKDYKVEKEHERNQESLIILNEDRNIEVIYLGDVILIQENGAGFDCRAAHVGRTFIWRDSEGVDDVVTAVSRMIVSGPRAKNGD